MRPKHKWPEYVEGELTPSSAHGFGCFGSKTHNILHILRHFTSQASCLRSKSKRWKRKMPSLGPLPRDLPFLQNKLSDRWESRREKLVNQIVDLDPDVVSLVTLGIRMGPLVISMSQLWSQVELDDHAFFGQSLEGEWDPDFRISFLSHAATVRVQPHGHPRAIPGPSVRTQCSASARAPTARTAAGSSGGVVNSSWWPVRQEPS